MVSKPSIAGWGLNWQHCARNIFVGVSHSFEQWYQAIRRTYRFGQSRAVECHLIRSDADGAVVASLRRKQSDAEAMVSGMLAEVSEVNRENLGAPRNPSTDLSVATLGPWPPWLGEEVA